MAELVAGLRGESEERAFESFLLAFEVVPVDGEAARLGFPNPFWAVDCDFVLTRKGA